MARSWTKVLRGGRNETKTFHEDSPFQQSSTLLLLFCVMLCFADRSGTFRPFQEIKSEDVKEVQVVNGNRVIHIMSEAETEELIGVLNYLTHNGFADDLDLRNLFGGGGRFVLEFHDGRRVSVEGLVSFPDGCYLVIDTKPYYDVEGESAHLLSNLFSEYFKIWCENGMK